MLTTEKLEGLLNVPMKCEEGRLLRLMSCDNSIKSLFLYYQFDGLVYCKFDERVKASIYKFDEMINYILENEGKVDKKRILEIDTNAILPTKQIISNAILEIQNWYNALENILNCSKRIMLYSLVNNLSMINYIILANFCGIADFCKSINNSRILRRFINFQSQTKQLSKGCISFETYLSEVANHKVYIENMYNIYTGFELTEEDFLTFMLLFDIRKNRNMIPKRSKKDID